MNDVAARFVLNENEKVVSVNPVCRKLVISTPCGPVAVAVVQTTGVAVGVDVPIVGVPVLVGSGVAVAHGLGVTQRGSTGVLVAVVVAVAVVVPVAIVGIVVANVVVHATVAVGNGVVAAGPARPPGFVT